MVNRTWYVGVRILQKRSKRKPGSVTSPPTILPYKLQYHQLISDDARQVTEIRTESKYWFVIESSRSETFIRSPTQLSKSRYQLLFSIQLVLVGSIRAKEHTTADVMSRFRLLTVKVDVNRDVMGPERLTYPDSMSVKAIGASETERFG